jgi:hypothetical protein
MNNMRTSLLIVSRYYTNKQDKNRQYYTINNKKAVSLFVF